MSSSATLIQSDIPYLHSGNSTEKSFPLLANRLAGKSISIMTYFVLSDTIKT